MVLMVWPLILLMISLEVRLMETSLERIEALGAAAQACEAAIGWPEALVFLAVIALVAYIFYLMTG